MDMIWVVPENRGQGAGLQLFNFWEHEMKKEKCFTLLDLPRIVVPVPELVTGLVSIA